MLNFIETVFTLLSINFLTANPIGVLTFGSLSEEYSASSNNLESLIKTFIYGVACFFLIVRWKNVLYRLIKKDKLIWIVFATSFIVLISYFWSSFPEVTLRRSFLFLGITLYGIYFGTRYTFKQQLEFLAWGFRIVVFMSLFFCIALPQYGTMHGLHQGAWRGIFMHKNGLGGSMALSSIVFFILLMRDGTKVLSTWVFLFISIVLMISSRSSTALVTFVAVVLLLLLYRVFRLRYNLMIPILIFILLTASGFILLVLNNSEVVVGLIGKDLTLTGRTELWPFVWEAIQKRPLLGYGYEGFWFPENSEAWRIWTAVGWKPTHPHNGTLKLLLEIGWLGTLTFLLSFFLSFLKSLALIRLTKTSEYYFPIALMTFIFLSGLTESSFMETDITWVFYICICLIKLDKEQSWNQASFK